MDDSDGEEVPILVNMAEDDGDDAPQLVVMEGEDEAAEEELPPCPVTILSGFLGELAPFIALEIYYELTSSKDNALVHT